MYQILAIDDDSLFLTHLTSLLKYQNYIVQTTNSSQYAIEILKKHEFHCVLLDVQMPGLDGISLLQHIKKYYTGLPVIMISGKSTLATAVRAIKEGAFDFIEKGADMNRLLIILKNAIAHYNWLQEKNLLINELLEKYQMVGRSKAMQKIFSQIDFAAPTDIKVLISGETGTGKELVARAIQLKSKRYSKPFVRVNCAAIPDTLIESTLFGHKKGSFTGAHKDQLGKFEAANGGTIFLDEISELSMQAQAKLLNVLQDGRIEKVGEASLKKVDVRIIAATNKNLQQLVEEKKFREDLLHRLNVFHIYIPPLRERIEDIPVLVDYFIKIFAQEFDKEILGISPIGLKILMDYHWPGNIRMLRNVINRAVMFATDKFITPEEISLALDMDRAQPLDKPHILPLNDFLQIQERRYLQQIMLISNGDRKEMTRLLGVDRATLWRKIKKYNLL